MDYHGRCAELIHLASFDESQPYEVDEGGIYMDQDGKFYLLTASGCSCWDGDFTEEQYDSLDALAYALLGDDGQRWNPSLVTAREMIAEARRALQK